MDKKTRYKEAGGASSDEDEAFESADEGEEGSKSSRPSFATSAGDDSSNSTSKEPVGKNDTSEKPLAISASDKNLETTELDKEVPKMAENVAEETKAAEDTTEDIPSVVTESSPKDVSGNREEGNKEETDSSSIKDTEDEKGDAEIEKESEQKQESVEEKSSTTGMEQAEESSAGRDSQGQNEQSSVVLDQKPFKENVESYTSSASDIEPIRYSVLLRMMLNFVVHNKLLHGGWVEVVGGGGAIFTNSSDHYFPLFPLPILLYINEMI